MAKYRKITDEDGWPVITPGHLIALGEFDQRIPQIRKRLLMTDDLKHGQQDIDNNFLYDENFQQAIRLFQWRHGLAMDGVIGRKTIATMNIPEEDKIDQIRVNLERLRWVRHETDSGHVLVDIPGFKAYYLKNGQQLWHGRIQVGKKYNQTPVFKGEMGYLVFNPTWTIPPGIIKRKILPKLRENQAYLVENGYFLFDRKGNVIDSLSIDRVSLQSFPYVIRQPTGQNNMLGQVKFIFPNPDFVYLHDANDIHLFERNARTFSSGCIRLENPFQLAELLLEENSGWDKSKIEKGACLG